MVICFAIMIKSDHFGFETTCTHPKIPVCTCMRLYETLDGRFNDGTHINKDFLHNSNCLCISHDISKIKCEFIQSARTNFRY